MSQPRIDYATVSASSKDNSTPTADSTNASSPTFRLLSGNFSEDSLTTKVRQLRRRNPKFAALVEELVNDALREGVSPSRRSPRSPTSASSRTNSPSGWTRWAIGRATRSSATRSKRSFNAC
jgi:hypothetical protein